MRKYKVLKDSDETVVWGGVKQTGKNCMREESHMYQYKKIPRCTVKGKIQGTKQCM